MLYGLWERELNHPIWFLLAYIDQALGCQKKNMMESLSGHHATILFWLDEVLECNDINAFVVLEFRVFGTLLEFGLEIARRRSALNSPPDMTGSLLT